MQLLYEILPVFLFFLAFKFYDIYVATVVGIVATFLQVVLHRFWKKEWDRKQLVTLVVFVFFGSLTLYFHNPIFVKWKPTIIFWVFAAIIFASQLFMRQTLMQRMMQGALADKGHIPLHVWKKINVFWGLFFTVLGIINLYVAYFYSNNTWVNFKFYGISSALIIFCIIQALYLSRYLSSQDSK